jgi:hypothetical protein
MAATAPGTIEVPSLAKFVNRARALDLGILLLVFLPRLAFLASTRITYEDSLITLRYAENCTRGLGLVYNPGERVFGASTPFYVLFLTLLSAAGLPDPLMGAKVACALADAVTALIWFRLLSAETRSAWAGSLFVAAFAVSPLLLQNSVSGMETSFALLWLTVAFAADYWDRPILLGVSLGLLALTRPDALLAAAIVLGLRALRRRRIPWLPAVLLALALLPWLIFAWLYYGTPIPNSLFAKLSAYNAHRPSVWPNVAYTLTQFAPYRGTPAQKLFNTVIAALLLAGLAAVVRRRHRLLPVALFWATWWAFLVLPRTLLFLWYYPPLVMAAYVAAAVGFDAAAEALGVRRSAFGKKETGTERLAPKAERRLWRSALCALPPLLVACAIPWGRTAAQRSAAIQEAEVQVRRSLGIWLALHTPANATVATEPIGYIGYYSGRRILDEVGLVSPQVIPFTRAGSGWFGRLVRAFQPDYVVERPYYLARNITINTHVPMFESDQDRRWFDHNYQPVTEFAATLALPDRLERDYDFVVYLRRR